MQLLVMLTSQNFAGLSILTLGIDPENLRSIPPRLAIHRTISEIWEKAGM